MTRYSKEELIRILCMILYGWRMCMNVLFLPLVIMITFLFVPFSSKLRHANYFKEYVKDAYLKVHWTGLYKSHNIFFFLAFFPIMVIVGIIINTFSILSNGFLSFAVIVGISLIYGWYVFKVGNILEKNGIERYFEEFSEKPFKWQMKCMSFALLFLIFEVAALFIFSYFILPE